MGILPMGSDSEIMGPACGMLRSASDSDETTPSFRYVLKKWHGHLAHEDRTQKSWARCPCHGSAALNLNLSP